MPAPSLSIPVRANLDAFKRQMEETSSLAKTAARKAAQSFLEANREMASAAGAAAFNTAGMAALQLAGRVALVVGAAKLMGDAIGQARDQLKDMVALANSAQNLGVSSSFLQRTRAEAKGLQISVEELDGALAHAFNSTKDKSPVDLGAWDTGKDRITDVERALRIYNETLAKAAGQRLEGLVLFRDADTQEKKVEAVLKAMIQLEQIGQRAASLDLGERMFGSAFVDRIRQGRTSAESLLNTIQKASGDADGIFPDALVQRAKEMDDQLKIAHQRLSTALKPSWDDLADVLLTIKGYWADTVGLIAKAVELSNQIGKYLPVTDNSLDAKRSALDTVNRRLNGTSGWTETYGILASRKTLEDQRDRLQAEIAAMATGDQYGPNLPSASRGTGAAPTPRSTATGGIDKLDAAAESIQKRTAALTAEASAIDLGTAARERAKVEAQLLAVAMQANAAAGKGENVVTEEQRKRINEVADAYSKAAEAIQKARVASSIRFDSQTALLSPEDVQIANALKGIYPDVATALGSVEAQAMRTNEVLRGMSGVLSSQLTTGLTDILDGTKSVSQGFSDMSKAIVRALEEAIIKMMVVAPIMRALQGLAGGFLGGAGGGTLGLDGLAAIHHGGYGPGDAITVRNVSASHFATAPRYHGGVGADERAAIIRNDEAVLTPGQMRMLAPVGQTSGDKGPTINVINQSSGRVEQGGTRRNPDGSVDVFIRDAVRGVMVDDAAKNGPISQGIAARQAGFNGR
jgi:hypothetical protein